MKNKNRYRNLIVLLLGVILGCVSCDNMLEVDSDRLDFPGNQDQNNIHSMIGIYSELQELAVPYVLMGELRADLLELSPDAQMDLQEIYTNKVSQDNPYNIKSDYYSVINQCNYLINNIDTSLIEDGIKTHQREYAQAKAIRAWTYMQLTLNYGSAKYIEEPLLSVEDADGDFPVYTIEDLAPVLVNDLLPWVNTQYPDELSFGEDITSDRLMFPIYSLIGDLYLWMGEYDQAAQAYYKSILENGAYLNERNRWEVVNGEFTTSMYISWLDCFELEEQYSSGTQITLIASSLEYGREDVLGQMFMGDLDNLDIAPILQPSPVAISNWDEQTYYGGEELTRKIDLRGPLYWGSYNSPEHDIRYVSDWGERICKFRSMSTEKTSAIAINRLVLLYLRYAEAVNRSGRPETALAILKYGLDEDIYLTDSLVSRSELFVDPSDSLSEVISYLDFSFSGFQQMGIHSRGCGESEFNEELTFDYILKDVVSPTKLDSIEKVEELIIMELALETAFEGNRFHDLMRVSKRRGDNEYLANRVEAKYNGDESPDMSVESNWYLP